MKRWILFIYLFFCPSKQKKPPDLPICLETQLSVCCVFSRVALTPKARFQNHVSLVVPRLLDYHCGRTPIKIHHHRWPLRQVHKHLTWIFTVFSNRAEITSKFLEKSNFMFIFVAVDFLEYSN